MLAAIGIGFSVLPMVNAFAKPEHNKDYSAWWWAAQAVRTGRPMFPPGSTDFDTFIYPPGSAVSIYTPLSLLGFPAMVAIICVLTFLSHVVAVAASVKLATGRVRHRHPLIYILPTAVTLPFVWDCYFLGQANLSLLALMLLGALALEKARSGLAGALFAVCAVAKAFPATAMGYLVWRRRWKAAAAMLAVAVGLLIVLPAPIRGWDRNLQETATWIDRMVLSTSGENLANRPSRAYRFGNQSLVAVVGRLTRDIEAGRDNQGERFRIRVNAVDLPPRVSFMIFAGIAAALCLAYVLAMPSKRAMTPRTSGIEYAILLILMVIFSPKAGSYYFCWIMPALAIACARWVEAPRGSWRRRLIAGSTIGSVGVMATALTQPFDPTTQALGATLWGTMILLGLMLALLAIESRQPPPPHPVESEPITTDRPPHAGLAAGCQPALPG